MGNNPSVKRFRADMLVLENQMAQSFHETVLRQADEVIANMRRAVPVDSGTLRDSIRKKDVSQKFGDILRVSVLVIAGGPSTTRHPRNGEPYDYAVATEFGTRKEAAEPFFYSTYRYYLNGARQEWQEAADQVIEENNKVRANRANNYTNGEFSRSVSQRGAVVIRPGARR